MKHKPIFITGIGTGIGKTIVSAILTEKLNADYWKPIQSGDLNYSDTNQVKKLVSNPISKFHPETYQLTLPFSPHKSAKLDGITINLEAIKLPETHNQLLIEGAGGLMVPLNKKDLIINMIKKLDAEVILVIKHYLGSINHSLLSLMALKAYGIHCKGIIYNGGNDEFSEKAIADFNQTEVLGRIPQLKEISKYSIYKIADEIKGL